MEKKAKPMIVVMPAGHTSPSFGMGAGRGMHPTVDEFGQDFVKAIRPYVESHYRVLTGPRNRAIAGLSMGGMQTLNIAISDLNSYSYIGVFSSGIFSSAPSASAKASPAAPGPPPADWEKEHLAVLDDPAFKKDLKLLWFATGSEDFLVSTTKATWRCSRNTGFLPSTRRAAADIPGSTGAITSTSLLRSCLNMSTG